MLVGLVKENKKRKRKRKIFIHFARLLFLSQTLVLFKAFQKASSKRGLTNKGETVKGKSRRKNTNQPSELEADNKST